MTEQTPEQIAAGLSPNEQRDLIRLQQGEHHPAWSIFNLILQGLATYRRKWFLFGPRVVLLTRKGLRVRQILKDSQ
jgi:hypothetical protein